MSTLSAAILAVAIPFLYIIRKLLAWFLSPYFIDRDDPLPRIKPYTFHDSNSSKTSSFPTIHDSPSKCMSLVFPAYNEEQRLRACLDPTIKYLIGRENNHKKTNNSSPFSWEIIVVNDGSKDKTASIVQEYANKYTTDRIRLLSYDINQGKGFAVQQGMLHARGSLVLFADADGASEITHLDRLEQAVFGRLNKRNHFECSELDCIAIGSRAHLQKQAEAERTLLRNVLMWGFHFAVSYIGNVRHIKDTQCGFKLFTRASVRKTVLLQRIRRWCFDPELLMLAQTQKIPVCEIQIKWQEIEGSKIQPLKASFNMLRELVLVRICFVFGVWYTELKQNSK